MLRRVSLSQRLEAPSRPAGDATRRLLIPRRHGVSLEEAVGHERHSLDLGDEPPIVREGSLVDLHPERRAPQCAARAGRRAATQELQKERHVAVCEYARRHPLQAQATREMPGGGCGGGSGWVVSGDFEKTDGKHLPLLARPAAQLVVHAALAD